MAYPELVVTVGGNGQSPMDYARANPEQASALTKLTTNINGYSPTQGQQLQNMNSYAFRASLMQRAKKNADNRMILRLLPDVEMAVQILVSAILSPKDMVSSDLFFEPPKKLLKTSLENKAMNVLRTFFEEEYPIKKELYTILRNSLAEKGAYPIAVLPENAIDAFINQDVSLSLENMRTDFSNLIAPDGSLHTIGRLGSFRDDARKDESSPKLRMESHYATGVVSTNQHLHYKDDKGNYTAEEYITVIDNPAVFSVSRLNQQTRDRAQSQLYKNRVPKSGLEHLSMENFGMSTRELEQSLYKNHGGGAEVTARLPNQHELKRRSAGKPLIINLPSESIIPVHVPGNAKKHVAYFVLLDQDGNPIEMPDGDQYNQSLGGGNGKSELQSSLIKRVESNMGLGTGGFSMQNRMHMDQANKIYSEIVERDLLNRVKNGVHSSTVALSKSDELSRIMLARVLAKKHTQILYLPAEYVTYIAFKYGDDGVGQSIMDELSTINTMRVTLLFADVMSSMKNSIGRTRVTGTLDPRDPTPMVTVERVMDEIVRSRSLSLPLNGANPLEIISMINRSGYEWDISGHKGLPEMKFEFQQQGSQFQKPDQDLRDNLKSSSAMGFGLPPETITHGFDPEFATTVVNNNILLAKRVQMHQNDFAPQLTDHLQKTAKAHDSLVQELKELFVENFDEIELSMDDFPELANSNFSEESKKKFIIFRAVQWLLEGFKVTLPEPSLVTADGQTKELTEYDELVEAGLKSLFDSSFFTEANSGDVANQVDTIKAMFKAHLMRAEMSRRGILPELLELSGLSGDKPEMADLIKQLSDHNGSMLTMAVKLLASLKPITVAVNNDLKKNGIGDTGGSDSGFDTPGDDLDGMGAIDDIGSTGDTEVVDGANTDTGIEE